ncbi:hypothetical protein TSOC_010613 [Tetrabaena socialis]|uniref:Protein kinase domain-containing protein n=1 Tax=Tetrabaena socialis TaxID=47790 RepID=A0A2J7ZSU2_9CHLO|nr:hypothetical protein TSOC_010613 [Tetrabaena socialis]|eukprot:PNH03336.1 hypothetical protein TSOC_010613 [Tetrabaena socialis]
MEQHNPGHTVPDGDGRMPHHLSSAEDEPSSSGRSAARPDLRGAPSLLRSSSPGGLAAPPPLPPPALLQPADDLIAAHDGHDSARWRAPELRVRPPSAAPNTPPPLLDSPGGAPILLSPGPLSPASARKGGRPASLVGFFRMGTDAANNSVAPASAAPSRDPTLQGFLASGQSMGRMRRASFLQTLGFAGPSTQHSGGLERCDSPATARSSVGGLEDGPAGRVRSVGAQSAGRRRRGSMLDLFRTSRGPLDAAAPAADGSVGGDDAPARGTADGLHHTRSNLSAANSIGRKSRRASVIDFFKTSTTGFRNSATGFRNSATGLLSSNTGLGVEEGGPSMSRGSRSLHGGGGHSRRRSVIDILGHSSKRVFAKLMNQDFEDEAEEEEEEAGPLWFTSLAEFKPLTFKYRSGRYSSCYFACSVKTGEHYILKQYEKAKMDVSDERGVRRSLAFAQMLEHEHLVRCCGTWEDEAALYVVEEYATKGDLLQVGFRV